MRIDIDLDADALYVTVCGGRVARTVWLSDRLLVDLAEDGQVHGIEVLGLDSLPVDEVLSRYELPKQAVLQLKALQAEWVPLRLQVA